MKYDQNGYNLTDTSRYQWWISFEEISSPLATSASNFLLNSFTVQKMSVISSRGNRNFFISSCLLDLKLQNIFVITYCFCNGLIPNSRNMSFIVDRILFLIDKILSVFICEIRDICIIHYINLKYTNDGSCFILVYAMFTCFYSMRIESPSGSSS